MPVSTASFTLLLGSLLSFAGQVARAAPTGPDIALAQQFAPQFKFHRDEIYWPSTVDFFLRGVRVLDTNGNVVASSVTSQTLDDTPSQGSGLFISTDINAGKAAGGFLRGQNPASSSPDLNTFVVHKSNGVVDVFYWLFTPFNSAKSVPLVGQVGDHVGDWERLTVRTVNGVPTQVNYNAHSGTGSGTIPWAQVPKFDNNTRPVAYIAYGSHGTWASAGTFTYVDAVVFKLQDVTSEGGVAWDTKSAVRTLAYPDTYTGTNEWLNYKGAWGNKGNTDCWWYAIHNECQVVNGPNGPLRPDVLGAAKATGRAGSKPAMDGPLDQTLGTPSSSGTSSYTIRLAPGTKPAAASSKLAIQQSCVLKSETGSQEGDIVTATVGTADVRNGAANVIVPACSQGFVTSYTIGFCSTSETSSCSWASTSRILRAFHTNAEVDGFGAQDVKAIVVDDLDDWEF